MAAGPHALTWNGVDDQGRQAASGGYIVRFVAPDRTQSRHITLLK
jgi:flagellar hook assembly protein FlgD